MARNFRGRVKIWDKMVNFGPLYKIIVRGFNEVNWIGAKSKFLVIFIKITKNLMNLFIRELEKVSGQAGFWSNMIFNFLKKPKKFEISNEKRKSLESEILVLEIFLSKGRP